MVTRESDFYTLLKRAFSIHSAKILHSSQSRLRICPRGVYIRDLRTCKVWAGFRVPVSNVLWQLRRAQVCLMQTSALWLPPCEFITKAASRVNGKQVRLVEGFCSFWRRVCKSPVDLSPLMLQGSQLKASTLPTPVCNQMDPLLMQCALHLLFSISFSEAWKYLARK